MQSFFLYLLKKFFFFASETTFLLTKQTDNYHQTDGSRWFLEHCKAVTKMFWPVARVFLKFSRELLKRFVVCWLWWVRRCGDEIYVRRQNLSIADMMVMMHICILRLILLAFLCYVHLWVALYQFLGAIQEFCNACEHFKWTQTISVMQFCAPGLLSFHSPWHHI